MFCPTEDSYQELKNLINKFGLAETLALPSTKLYFSGQFKDQKNYPKPDCRLVTLCIFMTKFLGYWFEFKERSSKRIQSWIQCKPEIKNKFSNKNWFRKNQRCPNVENLPRQYQIPHSNGKINTFPKNHFILSNHGWVIRKHWFLSKISGGVAKHRPRYLVTWLPADQ